MPSFHHEAIIELFRARTTLAPELLESVFQIAIPSFETAITSEADLSQIFPTEYRADLVILLENDVAVFGIVVEAQRTEDAEKRWSWPLYASALRARHRCPVVVLVVTPDEKVAKWASKPIDLGPGNRWQPIVLGPDGVPRVTTEAEALKAPELGVLSVIAHGNEAEGESIALAAVLGLQGVDDKSRSIYYDLILASLGEASRKELQSMVQSGKYEYMSDVARQYVEEGRQEGRQEGRVADVLAILRHRGWSVSTEIEKRVHAGSDKDLQVWLLRAVTAADINAVFDDA